MSGRNGRKMELKLHLSLPPRTYQRLDSPTRSASESPPSSCVSSDDMIQDEDGSQKMFTYSSSPEATSMVLVGCPRCLMYVMLSHDHPKCPTCKSPVLLDFVHGNGNNTTTSKTAGGRRDNRRNNL